MRKSSFHKFIFFSMIVSSLIFLSIRQVGAKQNIQTIDYQAMDAFITDQVRVNRIPGMAVAVIQNDEITFSKGYGEASPGVPVTPQTQFYLGSISKSFTALAAMHLVEEGKLNLDNPVQSYLTWFKVADEEASKTITVRQLLNHTSGLSGKQDPNVDIYTDTLRSQTEYMQFVKPVSKPGTQYEYYNQNYRIIGCLIEEISGISYQEYLESHIFTPIGMSHTTTNPSSADQLAQGYSRFLGYPVPMKQEYIPGAVPSGYIISSAEDMAKYLITHLNNEVGGNQYIQPSLMNELHTPPSGIDTEYAMGWMRDENWIYHGGSIYTFQTFMEVDFDTKTGVILLFNQNSIQNMQFENGNIQQGVINFLYNDPVSNKDYRWIGWLLLTFISLDLCNHLRLFIKQHNTWKNGNLRKNIWWWSRTILGILLPLTIIIGLPLLVHNVDGGAPNWSEPLHLIPDLTLWLLVGLTLTVIRNLINLLYIREKI